MIGPKAKDNLNPDPQKILQCAVAYVIESHIKLPLAWDTSRACLAVKSYPTYTTDFPFRRSPLFEMPQHHQKDDTLIVERALKLPVDSDLGVD